MTLFISLIFFVTTAWAQGQTNVQSSFVSSIDQEITVSKIAVGQFVDNLSGIYAKPIREEILSQLKLDPQWQLVELSSANDITDAQSTLIAKTLKTSDINALLFIRLTKGPAGLSYKIQLNVGPLGLPLFLEEDIIKNVFDVDSVKKNYYCKACRSQKPNALPRSYCKSQSRSGNYKFWKKLWPQRKFRNQCRASC
jgi:hypothetical protein